MTKKEILKWRLTKLPSSEEVLSLVKDQIISKEEAREILFKAEIEEERGEDSFKAEIEEERGEDSLKSEIKFLREIIEKLSHNQQTRIIEIIKEVRPLWQTQPWYNPYYVYTSAVNSANICSQAIGTTIGTNHLMGAGSSSSSSQSLASFNNIKTF